MALMVLSEAARNLDMHHSTLRRWKKEIEAEGNHAFPGQGKMTPEKEEFFKLRKEVKRLKMEKGLHLLLNKVKF